MTELVQARASVYCAFVRIAVLKQFQKHKIKDKKRNGNGLIIL